MGSKLLNIIFKFLSLQNKVINIQQSFMAVSFVKYFTIL